MIPIDYTPSAHSTRRFPATVSVCDPSGLGGFVRAGAFSDRLGSVLRVSRSGLPKRGSMTEFFATVGESLVGKAGDVAANEVTRHVPVLVEEVMAALQPQAGEVVIDGTFGAGGYTKRILATGASVVAIDRDPSAIEAGRAIER